MTPHVYILKFGGVVLSVAVFAAIGASFSDNVWSQMARLAARDPGVRPGPMPTDLKLPGLTPSEQRAFDVGLEAFQEVASVKGTIPETEAGLGPRFNLDSCAGCHTQPAVGGTSPAVNPQVAVATAFGARNTVPSFLRLHGPVREARFKYKPDGSRDGGVHALFVISGRVDPTGDATGCTITQDDFAGNLTRDN